MANYLNEDDLWKAPALPKYISEEELFGGPGVLDYAKNFLTSAAEGFKGVPATSLQGDRKSVV